MPHLNELQHIPNQHFKWNKARISYLTFMMIALLFKQTSNLAKLSTLFMNEAQPQSSYRRIQRFLSKHYIDFNHVAQFIFQLFHFNQVSLTLDRTNWKWGKKNINILMLALVYKGIAIPLFWLLLNKRGNSCSIERIALIKRFIRVFGKDKIHQILADREFVGEKWFNWLNKNEIKFCIRVRKNSKVSNRYGQLVQVHSLFHNLRKGQQIQHDRQVKIDGVNVYLSVLKLQDGELLIVATNHNDADALVSYAKRWEIETLFSCLKSRGFNLEDSHLTDMKKIKKLLVVMPSLFVGAIA